jgi:hypothetical protein
MKRKRFKSKANFCFNQTKLLNKTIITKDQKSQNDSSTNAEFLAMPYFKNSGITNLEPALLVESY